MLSVLLSILYVFVCLLLLGVVLLQQGRGGDIAAAFGGASSQTAFGARAGATVLTRATSVLGALFMLGALGLAVIGQRGPGSVVGGVKGPEPATQSAPARSAPAPSTPAPATGQTTPAGSGSQQATPAQPESGPAGAKPAGTPAEKQPVKK